MEIQVQQTVEQKRILAKDCVGCEQGFVVDADTDFCEVCKAKKVDEVRPVSE